MPLRALALLKHRGITHSFAACAAAAALAWLLASQIAPAAAATIGAGVAIGYLAHIAADACTPSGVPLLAPVSSRRRWLVPAPARVPTGSLRELVVAALLTTAAAAATVLLAG